MPGGTAEALVAGTSGPGVLLCMDAIGLRPQLQQVADRIASWGYVVLAPNMFWREGTAADLLPTDDLTAPGERERVMGLVMPRVMALTADKAEEDLPVYLATLRALPGVVDGPVGVTGYCMGARLSIRAGCLDAGVAAVGGFHGGGLVTPTPDSPHLGLGSAHAEFVFGHADHDASMPPEAVAALGVALADAGLTATNDVYAGAPHGYVMADTPMYQHETAERHFVALRALFARTLR